MKHLPPASEEEGELLADHAAERISFGKDQLPILERQVTGVDQRLDLAGKRPQQAAGDLWFSIL